MTNELEVLNKLQEALVMLKEDVIRGLQKRENQLWSEISLPLTLHNALSRLTKDELTEIRKWLQIKKASQLNKGELIALLREKIVVLLEQALLKMDENQYKFLANLAERNGVMKLPHMDWEQLDYFRESGIVFTGSNHGSKIIVMPNEVLEKFCELENKPNVLEAVKRNSEWITLTQGLLYYYGTLTRESLLEMIKKYSNKTVNPAEFVSVIENAAKYYGEITITVHGYSNCDVPDPELILEQHRLRTDMKYFPFSKAQLLKAGKSGYIEKNESYHQLLHFFLQYYSMNKEEAESIIDQCVYAFRRGMMPEDVVEFLRSTIQIPDLKMSQLVMQKIVDLLNNTRIWYLKGYTLGEVYKEEEPASEPLFALAEQQKEKENPVKIGRNDPCPCGSGKKYKKCCGK